MPCIHAKRNVALVIGLRLFGAILVFACSVSSFASSNKNHMYPSNVEDVDEVSPKQLKRNEFLAWATATLISSLVIPASAAPPIAVIAEELGYFPVTNTKNETVYIPKRIKRSSTPQAIALAQRLRDKKAVVYTAYWCPHCARQKELFGREAWELLTNVECSSKGYNAQPQLCTQIDGFPSWQIGKQSISGERSLAVLAEAVGFKGFDESKEPDTPPLVGSKCG